MVRGAAAGATSPADLTEPANAIFYEDDVVHTARGADGEEAVVLGTFVLTSGEPLVMPVDMAMGTPAASPAGTTASGLGSGPSSILCG